MRDIKVVEREGLEDYSSTLAFQRQYLEEKGRDRSLSDILILVEHPPVYTTGRGGQSQQLAGRFAEIPWVEVGRGGQATFHGPGQLVAYPVLDLEHYGKDVHKYLRALEEVIIGTLEEIGIESFRKDGYTGVWVRSESRGELKIASIGVGVSKWVSYHGLALNVDTDLEYFRAMTPCGLQGEVMTSVNEVYAEKRVPPLTVQQVRELFIPNFFRVFHDLSRPNLRQAKPKWLRVKAPGSPEFQETKKIVKSLKLTTVCEEAHCPNIGECWSHRTATFMIMGELCTRRCSFCAVKDGVLTSLEPLDPLEPYRVGRAVKELGLEHVVITSVDRDDLEDMGADHFDQTVRSILAHSPGCRVELLIPDMRGRKHLVERILESRLVSVLNHNVETVPRLYKSVRPGSNFQRSLNVLKWAKDFQPGLKTKSGIMVGLGETKEEIFEVMDRLLEHGVEILTIGQYLRPTEKQLPVQRYVTPEEFEEYRVEGMKKGFSFVESSPLTRSSYHAWRHVEGIVDSAPAQSHG
jgi:lipoic acid synthetase